jgi:hypothetical protein
MQRHYISTLALRTARYHKPGAASRSLRFCEPAEGPGEVLMSAVVEYVSRYDFARVLRILRVSGIPRVNSALSD